MKRHQKRILDVFRTFLVIKANLVFLVSQGYGGLAHLGERLICIQEVAGSSPVSSTKQLIGTNGTYD